MTVTQQHHRPRTTKTAVPHLVQRVISCDVTPLKELAKIDPSIARIWHLFEIGQRSYWEACASALSRICYVRGNQGYF